MHFSVMYRLRWYRRAFTRNGASNKCGVGIASKSLARWCYDCCILRWRHVSSFDKKKV